MDTSLIKDHPWVPDMKTLQKRASVLGLSECHKRPQKIRKKGTYKYYNHLTFLDSIPLSKVINCLTLNPTLR